MIKSTRPARRPRLRRSMAIFRREASQRSGQKSSRRHYRREDTFSRAELADAIDIAQRTETTIFAISTKAGFLGSVPGVKPERSRIKAINLYTSAEETAAKPFYRRYARLERAFKKISEELRSQFYYLSPANQITTEKNAKSKSVLPIKGQSG